MPRKSRIAMLIAAVGEIVIPPAGPSLRRPESFRVQSLEQRRLYSSPIEGTDRNDAFIIRVEDDNVIHADFNGGVEIVNLTGIGDFAQLATNFNRSIPIGSAIRGAQAITGGSGRLIAAF